MGFDVEPVDRAAFAFPALTYWPKRAADRMAYLSLFPVGERMRANLMVYGNDRSVAPAIPPGAGSRPARHDAGTCAASSGGFRVTGQIRVRPADLCVTEGYLQAGRGAGGRRLLHLLPRSRDRHQQGLHRRRKAVQRLRPGLALDRGGWAWKSLRSSMTIPRRWRARPGAGRRLTICARYRPTAALDWLAQRWARFLVRFAQGVRYAMAQRFVAETNSRPMTEPTKQPRHGKLA